MWIVRGPAKFHELKLPQGVVEILDTGGGISLPQFAPGLWSDRASHSNPIYCARIGMN